MCRLLDFSDSLYRGFRVQATATRAADSASSNPREHTPRRCQPQGASHQRRPLMAGLGLAEKLGKSRELAARFQSFLDEQARELAAAEKALATARRAHTRHSERLKTAEKHCATAASESEKAMAEVEAELEGLSCKRRRLHVENAENAAAGSDGSSEVDPRRAAALEGLVAGPGKQSETPGRLTGGIVALVVEGEQLLVHTRVLAESPYFAARLQRWDSASEPLHFEIPGAGVGDVLQLLERLYEGPGARGWQVQDVAGGFRVAAVCALLMLDHLLVELANGIRTVATTQDIANTRKTLAKQHWPPVFAEALADLAEQHNSMPDPDSVTAMVATAGRTFKADRTAVDKLLAAWRGGLVKAAVARGLTEAVATWTATRQSVPENLVRWVLETAEAHLDATLMLNLFEAFAKHPWLRVQGAVGKWLQSGQIHHGRTEMLCDYPSYRPDEWCPQSAGRIVYHFDKAWAGSHEDSAEELFPGNVDYVRNNAEFPAVPCSPYNGVALVRSAYLRQVDRCARAKDGPSLLRALDLGLKEEEGRRSVHPFFLGACAALSGGTKLLWGPDRLLEFIRRSDIRAELVKRLARCEPHPVAQLLNPDFLSALEADEQIVLLESLDKKAPKRLPGTAPRPKLQAWASAERLGALSLPAKRRVSQLLLPGVAVLHHSVSQLVLDCTLCEPFVGGEAASA